MKFQNMRSVNLHRLFIRLMLRNKINRANKKGVLIDYLGRLVKEKKKVNEYFLEAYEYALSVCNKEDIETKKAVYQKILSGTSIDEISGKLIRNASEMNLTYEQAASFKVNLSIRTRMKQMRSYGLEWSLNNKHNGYRFIDALGFKRPTWVYDEFISVNKIPNISEIVVKPSEGCTASGVYLILGANKIIDLYRAELLSEWSALKANLENDLSSGRIKSDKWIVEELIFEDMEIKQPGRDLKFYCFYGKVALILEIIRFPEKKVCWWNSKGEIVKTGREVNVLFEAEGVNNNQIELAEYISSEIPAPFIRIDFIKATKGMVFGEFTPRPGGYTKFDNNIDLWLGNYFLDAEVRLFDDLLKGKRFEHFMNLSTIPFG